MLDFTIFPSGLFRNIVGVDQTHLLAIQAEAIHIKILYKVGK